MKMDGKSFAPWPWLSYGPSYVAYYNRQSSASSGSPMSSKYRHRQQHPATTQHHHHGHHNHPHNHHHHPSHAQSTGAQQSAAQQARVTGRAHQNPYHPFSVSSAYQQHHAAAASLMQQHLAATYGEQSRRKLGDVSNRLHTWKALSIAISLLAMILLTCKLYDVDREIQFLQHVADEWLSPAAIQREIVQQSQNNRHHLSVSGGSGAIISSSVPKASISLSPIAEALTGGHFVNLTQRTNVYSHNSHHSPSATQHHYGTFQPHHLPLSLVKGSLSAAESRSNSGSNSVSTNNHNEIVTVRPSNSKIQQLREQQAEQQRVLFLLESLREDVDSLIVELWSSRTTLVLSLIFVGVYIMSWCWMAYAIRETAAPHEVSLKTVLLLAIFAAVDIAASAGFVMVRIIMYVMRDYYFPRDMRSPDLTAEYQQLAAFAALRLVILKSSTSVVDVFVSIIVGFLTSLRVYSVICAVSFYRRARRELLNINNLELLMEKTTRTSPRPPLPHQPLPTLGGGGSGGGASTGGNGKKFELPSSSSSSNQLAQKARMLSAHRDLERRFSLADPSSSLDSDKSNAGDADSTPLTSGDPAAELKIQAADMPPTMQKSAMQATIHALRAYSTEKHIAESVKQSFDQLFEPTWHCIVGRNWGSCVTHTKSNYIRMLYKDLTILLYKSS